MQQVKSIEPAGANTSRGLNSIFLLASVFITGSCVLIIEILAIRLLSPYYGNTIYTTSSVLGIVLAALSLGYYFGGKLADNRPSHSLFYGIIFASGILTVLTHVLGNAFLPSLSAFFSIKSGPLVSSALLFFIPALMLGTLSPFAIKLNKKDEAKAGSESGQVFFWSTLGSIVGSLLAGFILIPVFGISVIIIGTGTVLGVLGIAGFLFSSRNSNPDVQRLSLKKCVMMALILLAAVFLARTFVSGKPLGLVYEKAGVYEKIKIIDGDWYGTPARFLFQDRSYSAAMYLASDELVYDYTKYYKLFELFNKNPKEALVIGGGAYSIPKALLQEMVQGASEAGFATSPVSGISVDVAEIEPELLALAKEYFRFKESDRFANYTEDGRRFLQQSNKNYDIIFSDVYYSLFSVPAHFTTEEFFTLAKKRLSEGGIFLGNFGGFARGRSSELILSEMKTFREVFDNSYFFGVRGADFDGVQNIIFLGVNGEKPIDFDSKEVLENKSPIISSLKEHVIGIESLDFSNVKKLTDDYAPVEYLIGKVIDRWQ